MKRAEQSYLSKFKEKPWCRQVMGLEDPCIIWALAAPDVQVKRVNSSGKGFCAKKRALIKEAGGRRCKFVEFYKKNIGQQGCLRLDLRCK